ncbi:hypothetical protein MY5147_002431 [Beauveria neobassiana]|uniref:Uncharacterized protein n=2 Tax=Beauveria bassiana TaxID=176275 RepID=A0A0A2VSP7_BEABA|nr:hypothetical protein BBAD15_g10947 [Beauveria bassiana D1-5]PQK14731.1 hypothetical protein BB8028_0005g02600 [Beauveria bassiana]
MAQQANDKMQPPADRPYKRHLDEAASHQTEDYREPSTVQKAVEKVSEYIPAASGPLQQLTGHPAAAAAKTEEAETAPAPDPSQLPERPLHDEHIEDFVREQHRQDGKKILEGHKQ